MVLWHWLLILEGVLCFEGQVQMIRRWMSRRPGIALVLFIVLVLWGVWGVVATVSLFDRTLLPFPDMGHRSFPVTAEAHGIVLSILEEFGLKESMSFEAGPTNQVLMDDSITVLICFDSDSEFSGGAISRPVKDPMVAATRTKDMLVSAGYSATIQEITDDDLSSNRLVVVQSDAFGGGNWALVFRRHILVMGKPRQGFNCS